MTDEADLTAHYAQLSARLVPALVQWFDAMLDQVRGQHVYAAAIAHAGGHAWRPDLNSEEALADQYEAAGGAEAGWAQYYRWWPDEWTILTRYEEPRPDPTQEVRQWHDAWWDQQADHDNAGADVVDRAAERAGEDPRRRVAAATVDALIAALGSAEVRRTFAARGCNPVLVVNDTDGGEQEAWRAFQQLNADRDDDLARAAARFWRPGD